MICSMNFDLDRPDFFALTSSSSSVAIRRKVVTEKRRSEDGIALLSDSAGYVTPERKQASSSTQRASPLMSRSLASDSSYLRGPLVATVSAVRLRCRLL